MPAPENNGERGGSDSPPPATLLDALWGVFAELPGLVSDRVQLLSLELRRAGQALARIVGLLVAAAILAATAWLALWGAVAGGLSALGMHWGLALLAVLLINLAGAALAVARMRELAGRLRLPATLRHLTLRPDPPSPPEEAAHGAREAPAV
ncbi:MAG TPA: phage holin family protein [Burkholderiaceae bacterium]|nr:phage holin family protein [Burkholderiaceae bacterium]